MSDKRVPFDQVCGEHAKMVSDSADQQLRVVSLHHNADFEIFNAKNKLGRR